MLVRSTLYFTRGLGDRRAEVILRRIVAVIFSPSITGSLGASTVTSYSGFLYSSTRNDAAAAVDDDQLILPERGVARAASNLPAMPP